MSCFSRKSVDESDVKTLLVFSLFSRFLFKLIHDNQVFY